MNLDNRLWLLQQQQQHQHQQANNVFSAYRPVVAPVPVAHYTHIPNPAGEEQLAQHLYEQGNPQIGWFQLSGYDRLKLIGAARRRLGQRQRKETIRSNGVRKARGETLKTTRVLAAEERERKKEERAARRNGAAPSQQPPPVPEPIVKEELMQAIRRKCAADYAAACLQADEQLEGAGLGFNKRWGWEWETGAPAQVLLPTSPDPRTGSAFANAEEQQQQQQRPVQQAPAPVEAEEDEPMSDLDDLVVVGDDLFGDGEL
ncbi:hypothetical protein QBC36DRAFT_285586 [Triangularia setosa]|uniref:Uncharacterized protein n=1 Tax=Triangularia setosa TaxID=2587417 RepID=A0AAN6WGJ0_9PEZI|nr:hypothetical protein QBC36DRAFT_285586 [Podospora setosa]